MPLTSEANPDDWIRFAMADLALVDTARQANLASTAVLAKLAEALEKFLKAFLVRHGWPLKRIHDVEALLQEAVAMDASLSVFLPIVEPMAEAYFEGRCPGFDAEDPSLEALRKIRASVTPLIAKLNPQ